jgi:hypothetical protein
MERGGRDVASGILPDVEGGILPPGKSGRIYSAVEMFEGVWMKDGFFRRAGSHGSTAGKDAWPLRARSGDEGGSETQAQRSTTKRGGREAGRMANYF